MNPDEIKEVFADVRAQFEVMPEEIADQLNLTEAERERFADGQARCSRVIHGIWSPSSIE